MYVIGVTIFVKCKGYLTPSNGKSPRDKALRGLTFFFFRVILVFLGIWVPTWVLGARVGTASSFDRMQVLYISMQFVATAQPILTFCIILTKPDVKKYITDLVFLRCVSGETNCCSRSSASDANLTQEGGEQSATTRRTSILGYTFSDIEEDDDSACEPHSDVEQVY